jgi:hypothetical protein
MIPEKQDYAEHLFEFWDEILTTTSGIVGRERKGHLLISGHVL